MQPRDPLPPARLAHTPRGPGTPTHKPSEARSRGAIKRARAMARRAAPARLPPAHNADGKTDDTLICTCLAPPRRPSGFSYIHGHIRMVRLLVQGVPTQCRDQEGLTECLRAGCAAVRSRRTGARYSSVSDSLGLAPAAAEDGPLTWAEGALKPRGAVCRREAHRHGTHPSYPSGR